MVAVAERVKPRRLPGVDGVWVFIGADAVIFAILFLSFVARSAGSSQMMWLYWRVSKWSFDVHGPFWQEKMTGMPRPFAKPASK